MVVDRVLVCAKPPHISADAAARVAQTLGLAAAIIGRCFPEPEHDPSGSERNNAEASSVPSILVTGGETLTGAVLVYLLKRKAENAHLYATCAGENDEELQGLCSRLVGYVAVVYAIDADAPDLFEHLQKASSQYGG